MSTPILTLSNTQEGDILFWRENESMYALVQGTMTLFKYSNIGVANLPTVYSSHFPQQSASLHSADYRKY